MRKLWQRKLTAAAYAKHLANPSLIVPYCRTLSVEEDTKYRMGMWNFLATKGGNLGPLEAEVIAYLTLSLSEDAAKTEAFMATSGDIGQDWFNARTKEEVQLLVDTFEALGVFNFAKGKGTLTDNYEEYGATELDVELWSSTDGTLFNGKPVANES